MKKPAEPGSKPLENLRWEAFARIYACGNEKGLYRGNAAKSYKAAGYEPADVFSASTCGIALLKKVEINQRVTWLDAQHWAKMALKKDQLIARTAAIVKFDPANLFDDGGQFKEMHEVDEETRMALNGIEVTLAIPNATEANPNPVTIATKKVRAADKVGAIRLLMQQQKLIGTDVSITQNFTGMADRLAAARKRLKARNGNGGK